MRGRPGGRAGGSIVVLMPIVALLLAGCRGGSQTANTDLFFPTMEEEQGGASMTALFRGPLVVKDGCVLIGQPGEYSLPVWWSGFTAEPDRSGRIVVRDADGAVVAVEGETFEMGGGYRAEFRPADQVEPPEEQIARVEEWLGDAIPDRCLTPDVYGVWIVGETDALPAPSSYRSWRTGSWGCRFVTEATMSWSGRGGAPSVASGIDLTVVRSLGVSTRFGSSGDAALHTDGLRAATQLRRGRGRMTGDPGELGTRRWRAPGSWASSQLSAR